MDVGGQHEWGELVQLDPRTVGVIVRLERETFQVCLYDSIPRAPPHIPGGSSVVTKLTNCAGL